MADEVSKIETEPGFFYTTGSYGRKTKRSIAAWLRARDIPVGLTYTQVAAVKALANLMVIVIRTLIEREVLDESFADSLGLDMGLDGIVEAIEAMGGSYEEPTLEDADE